VHGCLVEFARHRTLAEIGIEELEHPGDREQSQKIAEDGEDRTDDPQDHAKPATSSLGRVAPSLVDAFYFVPSDEPGNRTEQT